MTVQSAVWRESGRVMSGDVTVAAELMNQFSHGDACLHSPPILNCDWLIPTLTHNVPDETIGFFRLARRAMGP